jgi:hypothetical protein
LLSLVNPDFSIRRKPCDPTGAVTPTFVFPGKLVDFTSHEKVCVRRIICAELTARLDAENTNRCPSSSSSSLRRLFSCWLAVGFKPKGS